MNKKAYTLSWHAIPFGNLTTLQLYAITALREQVFVVEQNCPFLDADGLDINAIHLMGIDPDSKKLCAYLRVLAPGTYYQEASIGRVLTHPEKRGLGLGRILMEKGISLTIQLYPLADIRIAAQVYLLDFYSSLGFTAIGEPYILDGLMHQDMLRSAGAIATQM
jgi:ElaA protein